MSIANSFIDRPVLAGVLSVMILLAGLVSLSQLPIAEYPEVVPPSVVVRAQFPGANPQVIAETVASPLEESISGTEDLLYTTSQATSDGVMTLTATFALGTDPDKAQQAIQNRVSQVVQRLPEAVQRIGLSILKSSTDVTLLVHLVSPNERYDMQYLSNYAVLNVRDRLARIPGVSAVQLFGAAEFAMRIWLDPGLIAEKGLTAADVVEAIRGQNVQVAAGMIGAPPTNQGVLLQVPVNAKGRLETEAEFGAVVVRMSEDGSVTYLRDVARIELGAADYALGATLNNQPAVALPVNRAPGSNALDIARRVRILMAELSKDFPEGLQYRIAYDPTEFVRSSIRSVVTTLLEAIFLVVLVVIIFLRTWRAVVVPLIAVPVSIIGTFAVMLACGFSINTLSLFGLVLSIGIVVDDAIVVVENVERHMRNGMLPRAAAFQAMREVSSPIIAIALTLLAVFIPLGFMPGLSGQFYKECALTIAFATVISAFNSLTLSPALAVLLLKPHRQSPAGNSNRRGFPWFGRRRPDAAAAYAEITRRAVAHKWYVMLGYVVLLVATGLLYRVVPGGFVPTQDKQYIVTFAQLQNGAALERTEAVIQRMTDLVLHMPGVAATIGFPGMSINGFTNSSNSGILFVMLDSPEERKAAHLSADAIAKTLQAKFAADIRDASVAIFPPPPVNGLGTVGGFRMQIEDEASLGYEALYQATQDVIARAAKEPALGPIFSSFQINGPQLNVVFDREQAAQLRVSMHDVFETLQIYLGSLYVNDFYQFGRTYQVRAQAESRFRATPEHILQLKVRNAVGNMIPLSAFATVNNSFGPDMVVRYNGRTAADLGGGPAAGYSSGDAQRAIAEIAAQHLPRGMSFEWTDLTFQQVLVGDSAKWVFPLCVLLAFLVLAAQYESLSLPLAVILIVPLGILAALVGVWCVEGDNNIFTQIGFMVLVGLACKNAILIVEFARALEMSGRSLVQAAIEAATLRLRPIVMTSIAFIIGVLPLVVSTGAGAEARRAMGITVFAGMLGVTLCGLILTPVFYTVIGQIRDWLGQRRRLTAPASTDAAASTPHSP